MGGCDTTSYIAQAIAAIQLYMQRCRLMLEPGVTDLQYPEVWWEWMSAYRVWEANRKIFLYPENYLEPALRSKQTPQFQDLVDADAPTFRAFGVAGLPGLLPGRERRGRPDQRLGLLVPAAAARHLGGAEPGHGTGGSQSITLASGASPYFGAYTGMRISLTAGAGAGQVNMITSYDGAGEASVAQPWTTVPDKTTVYVITGRATLEKAVPGAQQYRAGGVLHAQP